MSRVAFALLLALAPSVVAAQHPQAPRDGRPAATDQAIPRGVREIPVTLGHGRWAVPARLTLPSAASAQHPVPAAVLVPGSGPATMDVPVGGTLLFREIAWGLAARGVATVRFTKRTVAHADLFAASGHRPTLAEEFTDEAGSAVRLLRRTPGVDPARVYAFGHSQGATLAATVANENRLGGAIAMAGSPRRTGDIIVQQAEYGRAVATDDEGRRQANEVLAAGKAIAAITPRDDPARIIMGAPVDYWRSLDAVRPIDQVRALTRRGGRALILAGGRDYLVERADWEAWQVLAGRPGVTLRRFARLNHMMQEGDGPSTPAEEQGGTPVSTELLDAIARWIAAGRR